MSPWKVLQLRNADSYSTPYAISQSYVFLQIGNPENHIVHNHCPVAKFQQYQLQ